MNKNKPLITVVVPIYKVEHYLEECINSVINQTYDNLEIILVDDGSPDRCGEMCDCFAQKDNRIKVIHQKNKGLSGARNSAIDIASGQYITFVDSDDWISNEMIDVLYRNIESKQVKMAVCSLESFFEDGTTISNKHGERTFVYSKEKALDCFLFNEYMTPCVCGKLYARSLWENVRCPEGKLYEDQYTTYKLIDQCENIVFVTRPLYHYRKRSGSIGHSNFDNRTYHLYDAIHEEYNFISEKYGDACPNIAVARITWELVFVNMMIMAGQYDKNVITKVRKFAYKNLFKVKKCEYISKIRKLQILLFVISYSTYVSFYKFYKRKHPLA